MACLAAGLVIITGPALAGSGADSAQSSQQDQSDETRARTTPDLHQSSAYRDVIGIDSADSCKLIEGLTQEEAKGDCPDDKTCVLQSRDKRSTNKWDTSSDNPSKRLPTKEYRANCVAT